MDDQKESNPILDEPTINNDPEVGKIEQFENENFNYTGPITWSAIDNAQHKRGGGWYLIWVLIFVVLIGASLFTNIFYEMWQLWTSVGLAFVIFITLIVVNKQPRQTIRYELTDNAVQINDKSFLLKTFQSFTIADKGNIQVISLISSKRFSLPVELIIETKMADEVVDLLNTKLPITQEGMNFTEKISAILKF